MEQKKEFTGVWIPKRIVEDTDLTVFEKWIYAEISCFEEFFMKKDTLAKRYKVSEKTIQRTISKLVEKGYVRELANDGRTRKLTSCPVWVDKIVQSGGTKMSTTLLDNNRDNKETPPPPQAEETPFNFQEYLEGMFQNKNKAIVIIAHYFKNQQMTFPSRQAVQDEITRQIRAANKILAYKYPPNKVLDAFNAISNDPFYAKKGWDLNQLLTKLKHLIK